MQAPKAYRIVARRLAVVPETACRVLTEPKGLTCFCKAAAVCTAVGSTVAMVLIWNGSRTALKLDG